MPLKTCTQCGESKPLVDFHKNSAAKDGRHTKCKVCKRAIDAKWRSRSGEHRKGYRHRTKQQRSEYMKQWYAVNPDYRRQYYLENKEANYERRYRWIDLNPEKNRAVKARRRALLQQASDLHAAADYMTILRCDPCVYCGEPCQDVDHIVPLSRGGSLEWDNLAATCGSCNRSKLTKDVLHYMLYRMQLNPPVS